MEWTLNSRRALWKVSAIKTWCSRYVFLIDVFYLSSLSSFYLSAEVLLILNGSWGWVYLATWMTTANISLSKDFHRWQTWTLTLKYDRDDADKYEAISGLSPIPAIVLFMGRSAKILISIYWGITKKKKSMSVAIMSR